MRTQNTAVCARCGHWFTYARATNLRRYCSAACRNAAKAERSRIRRGLPEPPERAHELPPMPPPPDWDRAYCTTAPASQRMFWTSESEDEKQAARFMCLTRCPELAACELWSMALPLNDSTVYAGMSSSERRKRRRAILERLAIQAIHGPDA